MADRGRKASPAAKPEQEDCLSTVSPAFVMPGLTKQQLEARQGGIGASDSERIMAGDWVNLWREKTNRRAPEDTTRVLAAQMGNATEAFNAYWYTMLTGIAVNRAPAVVDRTHRHAERPWMLANIDGLVIVDARMRLWEGKHTHPFGSKSEAPAKYLAQVQHCLEVLDLEGCEMSVLFGNSDWQPFSIERDRDYQALLIEREEEFWEYIQKDRCPPGDVAPGPAPSLELMRPVDFRTSNEWVDKEATWIISRPHVLRFEEVEKELKAMVPGDCDFAFGAELVCVRNKAGSLALRIPTKKDSERLREVIGDLEQREELEL
jgi:hypothetical protein